MRTGTRPVIWLAGVFAIFAMAMAAGANPPDRSARPETRPATAAPTPAPEAAMQSPVRPVPSPQGDRAAGAADPAPHDAGALAAMLVPPPPRSLPRATPRTASVATRNTPVRPRARPAPLMQVVAVPAVASVAALTRSPRPQARPATPPARIQTVSAPAVRSQPGTAALRGPRGAQCGNPAIQGESIPRIVGRVSGCGVAEPVRITAVDGVQLSQPAVMDCGTAQALNTWVQRGLKPTVGRTGGGVVQLQVAGHYVCRTRNHRAGARISEHGKGRAIDISGVMLASGQRLSILRDWRGPHGNILRAAHRSACGIFGTTLGPGSDGMHEDHLHFDTARHRNGPYCR